MSTTEKAVEAAKEYKKHLESINAVGDKEFCVSDFVAGYLYACRNELVNRDVTDNNLTT